VVYQSQAGFEKTGFDVKKINVNLEENYNNDFPEISKEIINGLNDKKKTNLVILSGPPGTGKTTYIRYLTSKIKKNIIFIAPDMVNHITDPSFIPFLMKNNDAVLIIEDAEPALQSRDGNGRTGAVSNVLNLTDGLLSDCLNISIVATFNTSGKNIDSALLRKGRLLKNYKFEKLSIKKSQALLNKLGKNVKVTEPMTLSEIYFYESDNNSEEYKSKKIGF
jgi:SpoVK/Ycf46/Vps4 family AAA+-type ATPase